MDASQNVEPRVEPKSSQKGRAPDRARAGLRLGPITTRYIYTTAITKYKRKVFTDYNNSKMTLGKS